MSGTVISNPPFCGRPTEAAELRSLLMGNHTSARHLDSAGETVLVAIGGERGIGKSRLLDVTREAVGSSVLWLDGHCRPVSQGAAPLSALREVVGRLSSDHDDELGHLIPTVWPALRRLVLGGDGGETDRPGVTDDVRHQQLCDALVQVLAALAERQPLVLEIEDVHQADLSTRDFITYLRARRVRGLTMILTWRTDGVADPAEHARLLSWLAELRRHCRLWITLSGLSADASEELARHHHPGQLTADRAAEIHRLTRGNPMLVELLASSDRGLVDGVEPVVAEVVAGLPDDARQLIVLLAVVGRPCSGALLATLSGTPLRDVGTSLHSTIRRGVLIEQDDCYTFRHPVVGEAVHTTLLAVHRIALHSRIARALSAAAGGSIGAAEAAHHHAAAGEIGEAARAWEAAAVAAHELGAAGEIAVYTERALEVLSQHDGEAFRALRASLHERAGDAFAARGDLRRALHHLNQLVKLLPPQDTVRVAEVRERCGALALICQETDEAERHYAAIASSDMVAPPLAARVMAGRARVLLMFDGAVVPAQDLARRAGALARASGDQLTAAAADITVGLVMVFTGRLDEGLEVVRAAATTIGSGGGLVERVHARTGLAIALVQAADHAAAAAVWDDPTRHDEIDRWLSNVGLNEAALRVVALTHVGRYDDATYIVDRAWRWGPWPDGVPDRHKVMIGLAAALLAVRRGDWDQAGRLLGRVEQLFGPDTSFHLRLDYALVRIELALASGTARNAAVRGELRLLWRSALQDVTPPATAMAALAIVARAIGVGVLPGEPARPGEPGIGSVVRHATGLRSRTTTAGGLAVLDMAVADATRRTAPDPDRWLALHGRWSALHQPYEAAYCVWREADACLRSRPRHRDRARRRLADARALAETLGAQAVVREVDSLARRARLAGAPPAPAAVSPAEDRAGRSLRQYGLTPREHDVLTLVATGDSNREIAGKLTITPGTVAVHVSRILAKLGVTSRVQAAALVHQLSSSARG